MIDDSLISCQKASTECQSNLNSSDSNVLASYNVYGTQSSDEVIAPWCISGTCDGCTTDENIVNAAATEAQNQSETADLYFCSCNAWQSDCQICGPDGVCGSASDRRRRNAEQQQQTRRKHTRDLSKFHLMMIKNCRRYTYLTNHVTTTMKLVWMLLLFIEKV